jgi:hypothetical protein
MPTFVLAYRSSKGYVPTPDTGKAWGSWFESMGDRLADLGKPVLRATSLGNHDAEATQLGGYSLVTADDLEAAVAIAKGCPALSHGGGVDVGELGEVPSQVSAPSGG